MTEWLPRWLFKAYARLWSRYHTKTFTFEDARKVLKIKDQRAISDIFSELRQAGWLTSEKDPENARRRIFKLRDAGAIFKELLMGYSK